MFDELEVFANKISRGNYSDVKGSDSGEGACTSRLYSEGLVSKQGFQGGIGPANAMASSKARQPQLDPNNRARDAVTVPFHGVFALAKKSWEGFFQLGDLQWWDPLDAA